MKESTLGGLVRYRDEHCPTGSFIRAVLENNLMEALGRADEENLRDIMEICRFLYWNMPSVCYGSPKKVEMWLQTREQKGKEE